MSKPPPPLTYDEFRTGLTFGAIRDELKAEQDEAYARGEYMAVTRHTVLGRWHQRKIEAWQHYLDTQRADNMKFLTNPGKNRANKGGRQMASKRRMPPRYKSGPKKGQFKPKSARKRNPVSRKRSSTSSTRKSPARRRTYRRNPVKRDIVGQLTGGAIEAGQILVGKAAVRSVPDMLGLPKQGNTGLAVQVGVALALGWAADMFLSRDASRAILAGGLTAPMETLIVAYNVPWLGTALSPTTTTNGVGAYVRGKGVSGYVQPAAGNGVAGYVQPAGNRLGAYGAQYGANAMYSN